MAAKKLFFLQGQWVFVYPPKGMFQNQQYAHIVSYCENDECRAEFNTQRFFRNLWHRVHQPVRRLFKHNQERHLHKFTEKKSESSTATICAAVAVIGIFVVTNVVAGIFAVIVAAVVGICISSTVCVWERELIKRVKMAETTGFNNSLLCKANDIEGVSPMCTDKETVKTKWGKEGKVNNLSLPLKNIKQNTKLSLFYLLICFILFIFIYLFLAK